MALSDFQSWRMEVEWLLSEYIDTKPSFKLALDQILENGTIESYGSIPVIEVSSYNILVQIIGLLKSHFIDRNIKILLRGQKKAYGYLQLPTLVRISGNNKPLIDYINEKFDPIGNNSSWKILLSMKHRFAELIKLNDLGSKKKKLKNRILEVSQMAQTKRDFLGSSIPNMLAWESVLQHYGYPTRWLDLVESIPISLWFASKYNNKKRIAKNDAFQEGNGYIFVYGVIAERVVAKGVWDGPSQRLINLAEATNPYSLRPHIQSAYSMNHKKTYTPIIPILDPDMSNIAIYNSFDYSKYLLCIIEVSQLNILEWLCSNSSKNFYFPSHLTQTHLFPKEDKFFNNLISIF